LAALATCAALALDRLSLATYSAPYAEAPLKPPAATLRSTPMHSCIAATLCAVVLTGCHGDKRFAEDHLELSGDTKLETTAGYVVGIGFVYITKEKDAFSVHAGSKVFGPYKDSPKVEISENHQAYAFVAGSEGKRVLVHNGAEVGTGCHADPALSRDGKDVACVTGKSAAITISGGRVMRRNCVADEASVMKNGLPGKASYDEVCGLTMGISGTSAFLARRDNKWLVIRDGSEIGSEYADVKDLGICEDGRVVYAARTDGGWSVAVDGVLGPRFEAVANLICRGATYAYWAVSKDRSIVLGHNGETSTKAYDDVGPVMLSADGAHLAHRAIKGNEQYFVVDGVAKRAYRDGVEQDAKQHPGVSPWLSVDGSGVTLIGPGGSGVAVVEQGKTVATYDEVTDVAPVARTVIVVGKRGDRMGISLRDQPLGEYDDIVDVAVSENGKEFAFVVREGRVLRRVRKRYGLIGW